MRTEEQREVRRAYRHARKQFLNEVRNVPCKDCGQYFPPVCMDFDHMPGHVKSFGIMKMYEVSMARLLAEISKCEIVCANCHRIRTESRR